MHDRHSLTRGQGQQFTTLQSLEKLLSVFTTIISILISISLIHLNSMRNKHKHFCIYY